MGVLRLDGCVGRIIALYFRVFKIFLKGRLLIVSALIGLKDVSAAVVQAEIVERCIRRDIVALHRLAIALRRCGFDGALKGRLRIIGVSVDLGRVGAAAAWPGITENRLCGSAVCVRLLGPAVLGIRRTGLFYGICPFLRIVCFIPVVPVERLLSFAGETRFPRLTAGPPMWPGFFLVQRNISVGEGLGRGAYFRCTSHFATPSKSCLYPARRRREIYVNPV